MLPRLRTRLRTVSYRNQPLQDILNTCKLSKEVIQVLPIQTELFNTILTTRLKTGKIRTHYYNRLDLGQILKGIVIRGTSTTDVIHELNTEQHCDFTEDDVEIIGSHLVAKENSLGFIGRHALNGQASGGGGSEPSTGDNDNEEGGGETPTSISATYDNFMQTMTVNGQSGLLVETSDGNGVIVGSGVIGSDGSVTYSINEDNHDRSVPIFTSNENSNVVEHKLTVSLVTESSSDIGYLTQYYITQDYIAENYSFDTPIMFPSGTEGRVIFDWVDLDTQEKWTLEMTLDEIIAEDSYQGNIGIWVLDNDLSNTIDFGENRNFRAYIRHDTESPIYISTQNCDRVVKFYDDGGTKTGLGYLLVGDWGNELKQVPSYLPKCLTNMNGLFYNSQITNNATLDVIADWDVSHVTKMQYTFGRHYTDNYSDIRILPIQDWNPINVEDIYGLFYGCASDGSGVSSVSNWYMPKLREMTEAFMNTAYHGDLSNWCVPLIPAEPEYWADEGQMIPPLWGTCPRGENLV